MTVKGFYHITVGSLPDYEDLVAEIYINSKFIGLISQEHGPESLVLELAASKCAGPVHLDLEVVEGAIAEAKCKLRKLKRLPSTD